jgi:hypothetical protein
MDDSERLQRYKRNRECFEVESNVLDEELADRIACLLNHPQIDKYCMVDAYYYDFSVIPRAIQEKLNLWRDAYLIFGITTEGEIVSKWVDRWDLDSPDPILEGKVMHGERPRIKMVPSEVCISFDPKLLSTPVPDFISKMFGGLI